MDGLITAVITAFQELEMNRIDSVFLTLQRCVSEIILVDGGNHYRLPHVHKARLLKAGRLPENACLTYLAHMRLHPCATVTNPIQLFGSDDSDLDLSDNDSLVMLEQHEESGEGVARFPTIVRQESDDSDDDDNDAVPGIPLIVVPKNAKQG